jgi:tetratricopeptide (TPR) repeat protein
MVKFCPECGFKLEKEFRYCPNCGYELGQVTKDFSKVNAAPVKTDKNKNIKIVKKENVRLIPDAPNKLSSTAILAIIGGILIVVLITLYFSNIFDTPKVNNNIVQAPASNNQSQSVDLSKLQEIKDLEDKIAANQGDNQSLLQLAHLKNDSGLFEQAIVNYKQYLEKNPSDADVRVDLGVCYYNLKNYDAAASEMKQALKYKPDHQIAHMNLGVVYMSMGKMEEAKQWFQKAIDLGPDNEIGKKAKELLESHK